MLKVNLRPIEPGKSMAEVEIFGSKEVLDKELRILLSRIYRMYCSATDNITAAVFLAAVMNDAISEEET